MSRRFECLQRIDVEVVSKITTVAKSGTIGQPGSQLEDAFQWL